MPRVTYIYLNGQRKPVNPFMKAVGAVVSLLVLGLAAFLGFFVFLAVIGILAVAALILSIRFWLFKKQWAARPKSKGSQGRSDPGFIDVEYTEKDPPRDE